MCASLIGQEGFELASASTHWAWGVGKQGQKSKVITHDAPSVGKNFVYCWVASGEINA